MIRCAVALLALAAVAAAVRPANEEPSLREQADRLGLLVGAAVDPKHFSEPAYSNTLAREFNMLEPENVMKWAFTEPARGRFQFASGDEVVAFAEAHRMKVRGHNLLWATHNPAWLSEGHFTPSALRKIMHRHIERVAGHYAGKVFGWDVVNEAFGAQGELRRSIWYDQPGIGLAGRGTAYIERAFRWTRQADPKALLFYNDYGAEGINPKSNAIYAMVKDFKQRGVPIDGVGLQAHVMLGAELSSVDANITRLARLGLQVHFTEMDVALPIRTDGEPSDSTALAEQAELYGHMAAVCATKPGCTAFQTWGLTDRYSWIPGSTHHKMGAGLLFDAGYRPKMAYRAVLDAFATVKQPPVRHAH
jgi:endo-1,4-beta-xylanase